MKTEDFSRSAPRARSITEEELKKSSRGGRGARRGEKEIVVTIPEVVLKNCLSAQFLTYKNCLFEQFWTQGKNILSYQSGKYLEFIPVSLRVRRVLCGLREKSSSKKVPGAICAIWRKE